MQLEVSLNTPKLQVKVSSPQQKNNPHDLQRYSKFQIPSSIILGIKSRDMATDNMWTMLRLVHLLHTNFDDWIVLRYEVVISPGYGRRERERELSLRLQRRGKPHDEPGVTGYV